MSDGAQTWSVWYPKAAATGLLLARGRLDPTDTLLVHAVPDYVTVEVHDADGALVAFAQDLERTLASPMCRLRRDGKNVAREDIWPTDDDLGLPVLLPGGEVGILKAWWNAPDRKEWRWQIELYNSIR
jgi:hypothetical protein